MNSTINVRIDKKLKDEANEVFDDLGIGMTSAMTMFLKAVVRTRSIPFPLEANKGNKKNSVKNLEKDLHEEENLQRLSPEESSVSNELNSKEPISKIEDPITKK